MRKSASQQQPSGIPVQIGSHRFLGEGDEDEEQLAALGLVGHQEGDDSDDGEYIDDYYAASGAFPYRRQLQQMGQKHSGSPPGAHIETSKAKQLHHQSMPRLNQFTANGANVGLHQQPTSLTSVQPSTITQSEEHGLNNASKNIAQLGQVKAQADLAGSSDAGGVGQPIREHSFGRQSLSPLSESTGEQKRQLQRSSSKGKSGVGQLEGLTSFLTASEDTIMQTKEQYPSSTTDPQQTLLPQALSFNQIKSSSAHHDSSPIMGSGLSAQPQPGAAAVPFFIAESQHEVGDNHFVLLSGKNQPAKPSTQQSQKQKQPKPSQPRKKRKMNDDYGIFYNYTCESDSSQTTPSQSKDGRNDFLVTQSPDNTSSHNATPLQNQTAQALKQSGFSTLSALKKAAAEARSTAQLRQIADVEGPQKKEVAQPQVQHMAIQEEEAQQVQLAEEQKITDEADLMVSPEFGKQKRNEPQPHVMQIIDHPHGRNNQSQLSPVGKLQPNTIVAPMVTMSSGRKIGEEKSFRHDFYSMDPYEANDQLGANPISLGMDGDFGITLTQTGLEALMDDELVMEMVMSRVDWIIKLRDIFYSLLEAPSDQRQNGRIRADTLLKRLIALQDTLTLVPRDEYALSSQRHEVSVSYGTILHNLRRKIMQHAREQHRLTQSMAKANLSLTSLDACMAQSNLTLILDDAIDLPFIRNGMTVNRVPNSGYRRMEQDTSQLLLATSADKNGPDMNQTQVNMQHSSNNLQPRRDTFSPTLIEAETLRQATMTPTLSFSNTDRLLQPANTATPNQGADSKRLSTPQVNVMSSPQLLKNVDHLRNTQIGGACAESGVSSSEPDLLATISNDESRQKVYGTKHNRRINGQQNGSQERSKNRSHSRRSHRSGKAAGQSLSPRRQGGVSNRLSKATPCVLEGRKTSVVKQPVGGIRPSESAKTFLKRAGSQQKEEAGASARSSKRRSNGVNEQRGKSKKIRRVSQLNRPQDDNTKSISGLQEVANFPQSFTPADSQVQLLSIDAFKYATQSPPMSQVTKTLIQHHQSTQDRDTDLSNVARLEQISAALKARKTQDSATPLESTRLEIAKFNPKASPTTLLPADQLIHESPQPRRQNYLLDQEGGDRPSHILSVEKSMSETKVQKYQGLVQQPNPKTKGNSRQRLQVMQLLTPDRSKKKRREKQDQGLAQEQQEVLLQRLLRDTHQRSGQKEAQKRAEGSASVALSPQGSVGLRRVQIENKQQRSLQGKKSLGKEPTSSTGIRVVPPSVEMPKYNNKSQESLTQGAASAQFNKAAFKGSLFEQSPIYNNSVDPTVVKLYKRKQSQHHPQDKESAAESKKGLGDRCFSQTESELEFPAPITQLQQMQLLNNPTPTVTQDQLDDTPAVGQEILKTSLLMFDNFQVISCSPESEATRQFQVDHTRFNNSKGLKDGTKMSPSQSWKHIFLESEMKAGSGIGSGVGAREESQNVTIVKPLAASRPPTMSERRKSSSVTDQHPKADHQQTLNLQASFKTFKKQPFAGMPRTSLTKMPANGLGNSRVVSMERLQGSFLLQEDSAHRKEYFDIDLYDRQLRETLPLNDLELRKGIKSHLRSMNLGQNLLGNFYELGQTEARQLLILNLSMNWISSLAEVAFCQNLQFLNVAHNLISDPTEVNRLRKLSNLQEVYLSHNKVDFAFNLNLHEVGGGCPSRRNYKTIWPVLEILDLSANRLSDLDQIEFLFTSQFVNSSVLRLVALSGNTPSLSQSSNLQEEKCRSQINHTATYLDLLKYHSKFAASADPAIVKACVGVPSVAQLSTQIERYTAKRKATTLAIGQQSQNEALLQTFSLAQNQVQSLMSTQVINPHQQMSTDQTQQAAGPLLQRGANSLNWLLRGHFSAGKGSVNSSKKAASNNLLQGGGVESPERKGLLGGQAHRQMVEYGVRIDDGHAHGQAQQSSLPYGAEPLPKQSKRLLSPKGASASGKPRDPITLLTKTSKTTQRPSETINAGLKTTQSSKAKKISLVMITGDKKQSSGKSKKNGASIKPQGPPMSRKPGIKQIQMVHLNPSQGSSKRSFSIQSNRSAEGKSLSDGPEYQTHEAYKKEGPTRKQGKSTKRNKSISSRQSSTRARILSPSNLITPRFDSYETLPRQSEGLIKQAQRIDDGLSQFGRTQQNLTRQGLSKMGQFQPNQTQRLASQSFFKPLQIGSSNTPQNQFQRQGHHQPGSLGVTRGLNAFNPNSLKLSVPKQFSPIKIDRKTTKLERREASIKSKTPHRKANEQTGTSLHSSNMRVKFKSKSSKGGPAANTARAESDSVSAYPHNQSQESGNTATVAHPSSGKLSKLKILPKSRSKQQSRQLTRVASREGSFSRTATRRPETTSAIAELTTPQQDMIPQTLTQTQNQLQQSMYSFQLKNLKAMTQYSKTVLHQAPLTSISKASNERKTPLKQSITSSFRDRELNGAQAPGSGLGRVSSAQRDKSSSSRKGGSRVALNQQQPYMSTNQSAKQMKVNQTQNTSTLLQKLQLKGKQGLAQQKAAQGGEAAGTTAQSRKLRLMASLSKKDKKRKQSERLKAIKGGQSQHLEQLQSPTQQQVGAPSASQKSFRLFVTRPDGLPSAQSNALWQASEERSSAAYATADYRNSEVPQSSSNVNATGIQGSDDERHCEALVASENLPNEPLMPRSHKSSARSFLRNIGQHFGVQEKNSKSFLQNVSQTSKQSGSTGLNSSQILVQAQSLTAPASKARFPPNPNKGLIVP